MEDQRFRIDDIYVPVKRKRDLDPDRVAALAESILEEGQKVAIRVRRDKDERLVLVEGLHRLEACRALGEDTIIGILVSARQF
jgi:sulfiredoxin